MPPCVCLTRILNNPIRLPNPVKCELCQTYIFDNSELIFLDPHPQHISCLANIVYRQGNIFCQHDHGGGLCDRPLPIRSLVYAVAPLLSDFLATDDVRKWLDSPLGKAITNAQLRRLSKFMDDPPKLVEFPEGVRRNTYEGDQEHVHRQDGIWNDTRFCTEGLFNLSHVCPAQPCVGT
jgi:hypothetical protein